MSPSSSSKTDAPALPESVQVGEILRPHGVRGEVAVFATSDTPDRFAVGAELRLVLGGAPRTGARRDGARAAPGPAGDRFEGVADRDGAEALRGGGLEVDRSRVPAPPAGTFYHFELIGCRCRRPGGGRSRRGRRPGRGRRRLAGGRGARGRPADRAALRRELPGRASTARRGRSTGICRRVWSKRARPGPDHLPRAVRALPRHLPGRAGDREGAARGHGARPARLHGGPPPDGRRRALRRRRRHGDDGAALDPGGARAVGGRRGPGGSCSRPRARGSTTPRVRELAGRGDLLLLCGRYEGIDERVRQTVVDEEISIGDYVPGRRRAAGDGADRGGVAPDPGRGPACASRSSGTASGPACSTTRTTRGRRWSKGSRSPRS